MHDLGFYTTGDFIGVSVNKTLSPSSPNASVSILILQDNVVEDTESFSVNLMLVTQGLGQAVSIDPVKTSVFIIDQDGEVTALDLPCFHFSGYSWIQT